MERVDKFIIAVNAVGMIFSIMNAIANHNWNRQLWMWIYIIIAFLNATAIISLYSISMKKKRI